MSGVTFVSVRIRLSYAYCTECCYFSRYLVFVVGILAALAIPLSLVNVCHVDAIIPLFDRALVGCPPFD